MVENVVSSYPCWIENKDFVREKVCLGKGSFCRVDLIRRCQNKDIQLEHNNSFPSQKGEGTQKQYFALKHVRLDLESPSCMKQGQKDLQLECKILQSLPSAHPNIIQLHSIGREEEKDAKNDDDNNNNGVFVTYLVLDRLSMTVMDKIKGEWLERRGYFGFQEQIGLHQEAQQKLWDERMEVIHQIANALTFIHQHDIVYRDVKPENIGFVYENNDDNPKTQGRGANRIKLFDFGLAKSLQNIPAVQNDEYNLTKLTGTYIYMSPEILRRNPYGKQTDVYSFALVSYHILALRQPFEHTMTVSSVYDEVVRMNHRPNLDIFWPLGLRQLISSMWDECPKKRPTSQQTSQRLSQLPNEHPTIPLGAIGKIISLFHHKPDDAVSS